MNDTDKQYVFSKTVVSMTFEMGRWCTYRREGVRYRKFHSLVDIRIFFSECIIKSFKTYVLYFRLLGIVLVVINY